MAADAPTSLDDIRYEAFLNGKYHGDREAYFDGFDRWVTLGLLLTGAAAFTNLFGDLAQSIGAAALSLLAVARLVFEIGKKARVHSDLRRRYFEVAAQVEEGSLDAASAQAAMIRMSGDEPPIYCAVHAIAENWATTSLFGKAVGKPCKLGWHHRSFRHFFRFETADFGCDD